MHYVLWMCKVLVSLENSSSCSQPFRVGKCLQELLWKPPGCIHHKKPVISLLEERFVQKLNCTWNAPTVCAFFSSLWYQMLTSGNSPAPEKSLVLHQVIPKFHKHLTFQNTFLGSFCTKEMTCWKHLLLTGIFKDQAKTSQTLSYCCNKSETMKVLFVFSLLSIANLRRSKGKVTFRLIFMGIGHRSL